MLNLKVIQVKIKPASNDAFESAKFNDILHGWHIELNLNLFCFIRSLSHSVRTELPSVAVPLATEEVTLPHSDPVPAAQVELAKPWIEVHIKTTHFLLLLCTNCRPVMLDFGPDPIKNK